MSFHVPNRFRARTGRLGSDDTEGNNGAFFVPAAGAKGLTGPRLMVIASDGMGWEHVSASLPSRCPTWAEMSHVKSLFWDEDDCVMQLHPPRSEYVNNHPFCLHLWRPVDAVIPIPPSLMVGFKTLGPMVDMPIEEARALMESASLLLQLGERTA